MAQSDDAAPAFHVDPPSDGPSQFGHWGATPDAPPPVNQQGADAVAEALGLPAEPRPLTPNEQSIRDFVHGDIESLPAEHNDKSADLDEVFATAPAAPPVQEYDHVRVARERNENLQRAQLQTEIGNIRTAVEQPGRGNDLDSLDILRGERIFSWEQRLQARGLSFDQDLVDKAHQLLSTGKLPAGDYGHMKERVPVATIENEVLAPREPMPKSPWGVSSGPPNPASPRPRSPYGERAKISQDIKITIRRDSAGLPAAEREALELLAGAIAGVMMCEADGWHRLDDVVKDVLDHLER